MSDTAVGSAFPEGQTTTNTTTKTIQKEVWVCDVCKVKQFEDFDEACRHEDACKIEQEKRQTKSLDVPPSNDTDGVPEGEANNKRQRRSNGKPDNENERNPPKRIPSIFNVQKKENIAAKQSNKTSATAAKRKNGGVLHDVKSNYSKSGTKKQKGIAAFINLQTSSSSENSVQSVNKAQQSPKPNRKRNSPNASGQGSEFIQVVHPADQKKSQNKAKTTTKAQPAANSNATLAAIFQNDKKGKTGITQALMAEQVSAEFQAKRRLEREREKERQKKRQETFFQRKPSDKRTNTTTASSKSKATSKFSCPRFPVPSFVQPAANTSQQCLVKSSKELASNEELETARTLLQKHLPFPGRTTIQFTDEAESPFEFSCTTTGQPIDSIQTELSKILTVSIESPDCASSCNQSLWGDQYGLTGVSNIVGETNQTVAKDLEAFVREWMVERHKSHQRTAEKQKKLLKKCKPNKLKPRFKDDDEDLWFDSDDEDSALPSICVIEGPVGSCKSSLVHAVARQCACPVVELNTSAKRGSVHLRKVLEEATLSHSSLDMLRKREANLFSRNNLVDSDDEEHEGDQGSSLTVILIDEADNIFESSGDNGFWSALNDLTKRALCPIFLTANSFPKGLSNTSLRFRHHITARPSPRECAERMAHSIRCEGLSIRRNGVSNPVEALAAVAELCDCDIRRIFHELQLFSCNQRPGPVVALPEAAKEAESLRNEPATIESVSPTKISSKTSTLLTIKGQNFKDLHETISVTVGGQECLVAKLVDDETILAVCPPCSRPRGVDRFGMRKMPPNGFLRPSLNATFAALSLRSGPVSKRSTLVRSICLPDGKSISVLSPCNVEYDFPDNDDPPSDDEEIELEDFEVTWKWDWLSPQASCLAKRGEPPSLSLPNRAEARKLLNEALERINQQRDLGASSSPVALCAEKSGIGETNREEGRILEQMARDMELASDSVVLENHVGVPFLAGASPGFGRTLSPKGSSAPLSRQGNITHDESHIYPAFYGDQDAWMVQPLGRELKLLASAHAWGRGQMRSMEEVDDSSSADQKDESTDSNEHDLTHWSPLDCRVSDEDNCLLRPIPSSLMSLPATLRSAGRSSLLAQHKNHSVVLNRLNKTSETLLETMGVLYCQEAQAKLLPHDKDGRLFLDYMPMLRNMATYERAAHSVPETEDSTSRRRTRKSARQGRSHYFESLNPSYCWVEENADTAAAVGERLAESRLHYRH